MCSHMFFKDEFSENADPQTLKKNGFYPVFVSMCFCKFEVTENAEPHTSRKNGFSLVCVLM